MNPTPLVPQEGWHVLHLFYHIEHSNWALLEPKQKQQAKQKLARLIDEIRATPDTQIATFAVATPKADIGFMLLTPDLHVATAFEKRLTLALGPDMLSPTYSYLSVTEPSEYFTTREQFIADTLIKEKQLNEGSEAWNTELAEFEKRMAHYYKRRVYPPLPTFPVICFYPMSKRRLEKDNWYSLPFEERATLMSSHAKTGRTYAGRVLQLITGSTGLDEYEWAVTLFSQSTIDVKSIVYEMRFDEVSAKYAEFGDFYIGLQLSLDEIFSRVCL